MPLSSGSRSPSRIMLPGLHDPAVENTMLVQNAMYQATNNTALHLRRF